VLRPAIRVVFASALAAVLTAAACGCGAANTKHPRSPAATTYVAKLNAVQQEFAGAVRPLASTITATNGTRGEVALRRFAAAVHALITRLRAIAPPPAVGSLHARLVAELSRYERVLVRASRRVAAGTPRGFGLVERELVRATRASASNIDATIGAMNAKLHG